MSSPSLANAELAVMKLLWQQDRLTARGIRDALYPDATKAQHGTVQKLLQRLEEKGFIERDRTLSVHLFSAAISREEYACGQLEALAGKLTGGAIAPLLTFLVEGDRVTPAEAERLRQILDEHTDAGEDA